MKEIKLCKDCKWCKPDNSRLLMGKKWCMKFASCVRPLRIDPVTGEQETNAYYCSTERGAITKTWCGEKAQYFEPKPKSKWKKFLAGLTGLDSITAFLIAYITFVLILAAITVVLHE